MVEINLCPMCERVLPPDAPQGLCPRCLLHQGLEGDEMEAFDAMTHTASLGFSGVANGLAANLDQFPPDSIRETEIGCDALVSRLTTSDAPEWTGSAGRYQIFGEIARGGMGAILRGRDLDLGRDLAVKVLLEEHRDQSELVQRFVEEAQIGGQLQHPGIVPVHELGTSPDRRPYFTMKLVHGRTLAALLAERTQPDEDRPHFLGIFEQVCQTMAYAHARGVIHRDLKPSNVMVGSFGEVQVVDWGLAKVLRAAGAADRAAQGRGLDNTMLTVPNGRAANASRAGSVLGTPAYMAPEQARGETHWLDERVDVFGLGAILCEILTGEPPYAGRAAGDVRDMAAGADISGAWRRLNACGADDELVDLARRCLSPLPRDRPREAAQVVSDLRAYLRGVQERLKRAELARVEAVAKAAEEKTRRRLAVGLAAAIVVLATTLAGGGSWLAWDGQRRAMRVELALRDVELLKAQAESAGDDLTKWVSAREAAHRVEQLRNDSRDAATRARVAAIVEEVRQKSDAANADSRLLDRLAEIRDAFDEIPYAQSDANYQEAFRAAGLDVFGRTPEETGRSIARRAARVAVAMATAVDAWAALRRNQLDRDGAARLTAVALAADDDAWRGRLRMALMEPDKQARLAALDELARSIPAADVPPVTLLSLGEALLRAGDAVAAAAVLRPAQRRYPGELWLTLILAQALEKQSRRQEAIRYYMMARAIRPHSAHSLAHALEFQGETDEAIALFRELIRLSPGSARHFVCLGKTLRSHGLAREADQVLDSGIVAGREAVRLRPDDPFNRNTLGTVLGQRGRLDEAEAELRAAIQLRPQFASAHHNLGSILLHQGHVNEAIAEFRHAIRLEPGDHKAHSSLGAALSDLGRLDEAVAEYRETIRLMPEEGIAHHNLGVALFHQGRVDDALAEYRETIRLSPNFAEAHYNFADTLRLRGLVSEAIEAYREAIRLKPDFAEAHCNLATELKGQGRFAESLAEFERGHELGSNRGDWQYPSAMWIDQVRRLVRIEHGFTALLRGKIKPASVTDRLDFAYVAHTRGFHATSARLWAESLALQPALANDPTNRLRFAAARCAVLAGCGQGKDEPPPDEAAKSTLRRQAREWLEADLIACSKILATGSPRVRSTARKALQSWKTDTVLAYVRDPEALAALAEAEQAQWRNLWADVDKVMSESRDIAPDAKTNRDESGDSEFPP